MIPGARSREESSAAEPAGQEGNAGQADDVRSGSAEDHAYFQHLERVFIELRGAPLMLSPADWHITRDWHRAGVPLALAEATMRTIFERRRAAGTEKRVRGLRFLRKAVARAWRQMQEMEAPASAPPPQPAIDVAARLARLAAALPPALAGRAEVVARIEGLDGDLERVEQGLSTIDQELLASAEAALDPAGQRAFQALLARAHQGLEGQVSRAEILCADAPLRRQVLRRLLALPVLSLFAAEAEEAGEERGD